MSRRVRSIRLRYCSAPVTVSVCYPTTSTRRCCSCQGRTSLQVSVFMLNLSMQTTLQSQVAFPKWFRNKKAIYKAMYGPSISMTEHHDWRKHRRIAGPSFTEGNNILVWESTIKVILGYFIKWNRDGKGSTVKVSDFTDVTTQIAFMVFSIAGAYATWPLGYLTQVTPGFGINVDWDWDKNEIPNGHTMPFMHALTTSIQTLPVHMFPKWLVSFNKRGREAVRAHDELEVGHLITHSTNDLTSNSDYRNTCWK